jgi:hypothetical protein
VNLQNGKAHSGPSRRKAQSDPPSGILTFARRSQSRKYRADDSQARAVAFAVVKLDRGPRLGRRLLDAIKRRKNTCERELRIDLRDREVLENA